MLESFHLKQHEDLALHRGKPADTGVKRQAKWVVTGCDGADLANPLPGLLRLGIGHFLLLPARFASLEVVAAIEQDPVDPRGKRRLLPEPTHAAIHLQNRV